MMSLHSSKELALLHLTNCMPSCNVKTIKQLSDGKLFLSIIERVFPEVTRNLRNEEKKTFHGHEHSEDEDKTMDYDLNMSEKDSQKELCSVVESSKEIESATESIAAQTKFDELSSKCEVIDVLSVTKSPEKKSISVKDAIASDDKSSLPVKNVDVKDEDLSKRYEFIECFIDEIYNLQSGKLITYKECMAENEFELAKVTLFVVSEVVRHYVRVNDAVIQTLSHLDIKVQQDLEDCFNLFINERSKITKTDIKKLLSSPALYKVSPIKSSFVTPKRSCSSKYKRSTSPSSSPLRDNFIDSPLKTYFESPIFSKKDIITKDKEILKTRQNLYEEEIKSNTLQLRVKEQEKQLKKKDKEINSLKTIIKEFQETEKSEDCENCAILQKTLKEKEKQLHEVESMEERYETLANDYEVKLEKYKVEVAKSLSLCKFEAKQAENRCEVLEAELDDIKFEVLKREQDIKNLVEELEEKTKECEISKEKLSAALIEIEKIPECSIRGESIGGVIEKENEELRQRIKQLELISLSKKSDMIDAMVQCTENCLDCKVVENSNFSMNKLSPTPNFCEKSESVIIDESLKGCPNVCDINKLDSSISLSSRGPTDAVPFILNNLSPVKNDCVGALWQQYNDSMTENESTNAVLILEKCVNKVMSSLQKFETEFPKQNDKHIKITSRANGSNGLVSSPVIKELMEDLKSLKKSLLCLSQVVEKTDVKFQNDNAISISSDVINGNDCISNTAVNSTCDTCLKKQEELPSSVLSSVSQDSAALLEKTKEFDILNEQFLTTVASLRLKEKELNVCKKKYSLEKRENYQNVKILKDLEIKCQKLQLELKDVRKTESSLKKVMNRDRYLFKSQAKEMGEKYSKLVQKYLTLQANIKSLREKNQKLEDDVVSDRTRNQELIFHIKFLERQIKELSHCPKPEPEQSTNIKQETKIVPYTQGPLEHFDQVIPKTEPLSPNECEASSLNTDIEENITASALYTKNLHNPFQLHTADEESFLNHSSIAGLSRNYESEDSINRVQELNRRNTLCMPQFESYVPTKNNENAPNRVVELSRRNTLCMPHLRSCYPAEGVPLNPPNKHLSKYVDFETFESALRDCELSNKERAGKKRKVSEMKTGDQSSDVVRTPSTKMKIKFKTPQSLHKLLKLPGRRNRRADTIKPKPE